MGTTPSSIGPGRPLGRVPTHTPIPRRQQQARAYNSMQEMNKDPSLQGNCQVMVVALDGSVSPADVRYRLQELQEQGVASRPAPPALVPDLAPTMEPLAPRVYLGNRPIAEIQPSLPLLPTPPSLPTLPTIPEAPPIEMDKILPPVPTIEIPAAPPLDIPEAPSLGIPNAPPPPPDVAVGPIVLPNFRGGPANVRMKPSQPAGDFGNDLKNALQKGILKPVARPLQNIPAPAPLRMSIAEQAKQSALERRARQQKGQEIKSIFPIPSQPLKPANTPTAPLSSSMNNLAASLAAIRKQVAPPEDDDADWKTGGWYGGNEYDGNEYGGGGNEYGGNVGRRHHRGFGRRASYRGPSYHHYHHYYYNNDYEAPYYYEPYGIRPRIQFNLGGRASPKKGGAAAAKPKKVIKYSQMD